MTAFAANRQSASAAVPEAPTAAEICAQTLAEHSKSFALAGKLLPAGQRRDAAVLYTYCRLVDDAIDLVEPSAQPAALERLRVVLGSVYAGEPQSDVRLQAFQELVQRCALPREYPEALLAGMAMDTANAQYQSLDELLLYCHRVAGVVGLMMCHVLGVSDERAVRNAAHLGMAMQLTNICRDVHEDALRGRLYLPQNLLQSGSPEQVTRELLAEADRFYASGDAGIPALPWRAAFSVRAARLIYSAIGSRILRADYDAHSMRAVVPTSRKLWLVLRAALGTLTELPSRWFRSRPPVQLTRVVRFPDDVLPL